MRIDNYRVDRGDTVAGCHRVLSVRASALRRLGIEPPAEPALELQAGPQALSRPSSSEPASGQPEKHGRRAGEPESPSPVSRLPNKAIYDSAKLGCGGWL